MKLKIDQNIRKYRKEIGLTQEELADRLGVSYQSVSRWENGSGYPDIELLPAMADLFGIGIDKLMGAAKEDRESASDEYYAILNRTLDHDERQKLLREIHHEYSHDATIVWIICLETDDLDEQRRMTNLLIELCADNYQGSSVYVPQAIGHLINKETEDKLAAILDKHTSPMSLSREMCLEDRYCYRKEWDKYEFMKQVNLRRALIDIISPRLVKDFPQKTDANNSLWASRTRIAMMDLFTGTSGMNPVSGDGVPDLWYKERLNAGFRYSCQLASVGEEEKALAALEDLTDLYEKFWNLPDGTVLTYRCPVLDKITATLHRCRLSSPKAGPDFERDKRYNGRTFSCKEDVEIHDAFWSMWDHIPVSQRSGWEWFDPIRNHPRYLRCVERMKAFESEEIIP